MAWYNGFLETVDRLKKAKDVMGLHIYDDNDIMDIFGFSSYGEFRSRLSEARKLRRKELIGKVVTLREAGKSVSETAKMLGLNESTVLALEYESIEGILEDVGSRVTTEEIEYCVDMLNESGDAEQDI